MREKGFVEGKNLNLESRSAQGKPLLGRDIAQSYVAKKMDVILGLGTMATQVAMKTAKHSCTKVIFVSVTDPQSAGLINPKARVQTITGVSNFVAVEPQLRFFKKLYPKIKTLGVIYNPGEDNSALMVQLIQKAAKAEGLKIILAPANGTDQVPQAAKGLIDQVDGYFISNDNTALAAFQSILKVTKGSGKPVFCSDGDMVPQGATAALGPDQYALGKQTADLLLNWLDKGGTPPPVEYPKGMKEYLVVK